MRLLDHMALTLFGVHEEFRKDPKLNALYLQTLVKSSSAQVRMAIQDKELARKEGRFVATPIFDAWIDEAGLVTFAPTLPSTVLVPAVDKSKVTGPTTKRKAK